MKLKRREWILILAVVGVLALVWVSGGIREGFDQSANFGTPNCPTGSKPNNYGSCDGPCPTGTTTQPDGSCMKQSGYSQMTSGAPQVTPTSCSTGTLFQGACYIPCDPGSTFMADARGDVICQSTISGSSTSSSSSAKLTPTPASSSSTQPKTVGIPAPCRPSYKSIPGGSMEFKCFS